MPGLLGLATRAAAWLGSVMGCPPCNSPNHTRCGLCSTSEAVWRASLLDSSPGAPSPPGRFKTATLTSPSLCICRARVVGFYACLISCSSLPPPLPPPPRRLLYCDHLRPVFPGRKNVRRDCCRMLPVSNIFANIF